MIPESQFQNSQPKRKKPGRKKLRKNYKTTTLRDVTAEGVYQKGYGLRKRTRIKGRSPISDPFKSQDAYEDAVYWLRVRRA